MKCDSSHTVTLSMETINGQSERETLLERALGTTKGGGPNRRSVWSNSALNFPGRHSNSREGESKLTSPKSISNLPSSFSGAPRSRWTSACPTRSWRRWGWKTAKRWVNLHFQLSLCPQLAKLLHITLKSHNGNTSYFSPFVYLIVTGTLDCIRILTGAGPRPPGPALSSEQ